MISADDWCLGIMYTPMIPVRRSCNKNHFTYSSATGSRKLSRVLLIIVSLFVVLFVIALWVIYKPTERAPGYDARTTMTQSPSSMNNASDQNCCEANSTNPSAVTSSPGSGTTVVTDSTSLWTTAIPLTEDMSVSVTTRSSTLSTDSFETTSAPERVKKVLFVIADGIPADVIENATLIHLKYIQEIGAYTRAYVGGEKGTYSQTATVSLPGYMSLLTGTWAHKHNVHNNQAKAPNYHYKNIFRLLKEQQPEKKIAIFSTWATNRVMLIGEGLLAAGNITFDHKFDGYELDGISYPPNKDGVYIYHIDERVTSEAAGCIREHAPDLSWVYLQFTDRIGHLYGDSEQFSQAILYLDDQIGRIWQAIDYRTKYHREDWLVLITTDHGRDHKDGKRHAGQSARERTTWIITNSETMNSYYHDFQPGIIDILPTIARYMDLGIPTELAREFDEIPLIGAVSLIKPVIYFKSAKLHISWTVLNRTGNVTVWLSATNLFKKGLPDKYTLMNVVPIDQKMVLIDVRQYPSRFYKIVLEGHYNTVNKWVYRP